MITYKTHRYTVLSTIVTRFLMRSSDFIHHLAESRDPFTTPRHSAIEARPD